MDNLIDLVKQAKAGQAAALDRLLERIRPEVTRTVAGKLKKDAALAPRFDASDVAQHVFNRVVRDLQNFKGSTSQEFDSWLATLIEHSYLDLVKKHQRKKRDVRKEYSCHGASTTAGTVLNRVPSSGTSPSGRAMRAEVREHLERMLEQIAPELRQVIKLSAFEGRETHEIANELFGGDEKMVVSMRLKAIKALRKLKDKD
jgi:RNA polymerase sigma factor (sigma-70 family)